MGKLTKKVAKKLSPQALHRYLLRSSKNKIKKSKEERRPSAMEQIIDTSEELDQDHPLEVSPTDLISVIGAQKGNPESDFSISRPRLSEEECSTAEAIDAKIQEIQSVLTEFEKITRNDYAWRQNCDTIHADITRRNSALMRHIVHNKMTGPYHITIRKITERANQIMHALVAEDSDETPRSRRSLTMSQMERRSSRQSEIYRSDYARALQDEHDIDDDPFEDEAVEAMADQQNTCHRGLLHCQAGEPTDETPEDSEGNQTRIPNISEQSTCQGWLPSNEVQGKYDELHSEIEAIKSQQKLETATREREQKAGQDELSKLKASLSQVRRGQEKNSEDLRAEQTKATKTSDDLDKRIRPLEAECENLRQVRLDLESLKKSVNDSSIDSKIANAVAILKRDILLEINKPRTATAEQSNHQTDPRIEKLEQGLSEALFQIDGLVDSSKTVRRDVSSVKADIASAMTRVVTSTPMPCNEMSNNNSSVHGTNYSKKLLQRSIEKIQRTTNNLVQETDDISVIRKRHNVDLPNLRRDLDSLSKAMKDYLKSDVIEESLYDDVMAVTDVAEGWIQNVETLYEKLDVHTVDSEKHKGTPEVSKFAADHTQTVYEFLDDFETAFLSIGSSKRRAAMMHKSYLSDWIKSQTMHLADDYPQLKQYLIDNYGDAITIVNTLVSSLEEMKKPTQNAYQERLTFYITISNILIRIERMCSNPVVQVTKIKEYMESRITIDRLRAVLPDADEIKFVGIVRNKGLDTKKLQGPYTLETFKDFIVAQVEDMQRTVEKLSKTPALKANSKSKVSHSTAKENPTEGADSESDDEFGYPKVAMATNSNLRQWWRNDLKFPCPMKGHEHELSTCAEFFQQTPTQRRLEPKRTGRRICWCCLRPTAVCKKSCVGNVAISQVLQCPGCAEIAGKTGNMAPLTVFFCSKPEHDKLKPNAGVLCKELKKYLKGLSSNILEDTLVYANLGYVSMNASTCKCPKNNCVHSGKSKSSPVTTESNVPVIDTQTGTKSNNPDSSITKMCTNDAFFLMQWIRIGKSRCLVMFDRGSNVNLIDGDLAEREGLKVIDSKPSSLRVVGGDQVSTEYGRYSLALGSKESGKFHEIECHGMSQVTTRFNKYQLNDINEELKESSLLDPSEPLPPTVGGSVAHLLIGIKDLELDPKHLFTLDSGIGVYRSPFRDQYGSDICYAGPHPSFTKTNSLQGNQAVLISMFTRETGFHESTVDFTDELPISMVGGKENGMIHYSIPSGPYGELHPSPLNEQDFIDLGCMTDTPLVESVAADAENINSMQAHMCSVNKAIIPISKMRELIDQDDVSDTVSYRCPDCSKCLTCKKSSKKTAESIQDKVDQHAINKSVHVDQDNCEVWVDLPFVKDPDEFLSKRHNGPDNYNQALSVYKQQCRKPENICEGIRKAHAELVSLGFIQRKTDLPQDVQELIDKGRFRQFMPWRGVIKEDSPSTPVRMVVDPTMTGLNLCLAKGENRLGKINEILLRNRVSKFTWGTDIKKMYNQLRMKPASLRYQLMLFHHSLDSSIPPEIWVMTRAWYGVTPSGNQGGRAVEVLVETNESDFPLAKAPLTESRFVDDCWPGADTEEERERQISDVENVLAKGGFSLKYVVKSREPPSDAASSDGRTVKLLGYRYETESDLVSPGFAEFNINKKIKGLKKANKFPVATQDDAARLLRTVKITRRMVMSKLAEFFDPIGLFEPLKLQYKLGLSALNKYDWDETLPDTLQTEWNERLSVLVNLPNLQANRCVIPYSTQHSKVRLICLSDAGEAAGGVVIYAGVKLEDGSYSCGMLTAKSRLLQATIPRNELTSIMHMAELAFIVKRALGDKVEEIIYATDSTIALSWCQNINIKLRMYVHNRVETIRRLIQWTTDKDDIPLYHLSGKKNLADLLTKPHNITLKDVSINSEWHDGADWMKLPTEDLPLTSYKDMTVAKKMEAKIKEECFSEPIFMRDDSAVHTLINRELQSDEDCHVSEESVETISVLTASAAPPGNGTRIPFIVDIIGLGWFRAVRVMANVRRFINKVNHRRLHARRGKQNDDCIYCKPLTLAEETACLETEAEADFFKYETRCLKEKLPKKKQVKFQLKDEIFYFSGRLSKENPFRFRDVDDLPFFDAPEIVGIVPVVAADSPVFFAFLMAIHTRLSPHAGVITTMKQLSKKMFVIDSPKKVIAKVREDCTTCRIILKKTVELEMQKHSFPRTMIAPVFYNCMMDIAYGFKGHAYKNARKRFDVYALVIVCLLTGATSILALEGLETQDVVQAIERHSCDHGVPAQIFIDNGTQLKALEHASFNVRDLDAQVHDNLGLRISVSNAKSHEERGRVERRIGLIRKMMEQMIVNTDIAQTALQWETLFKRIANEIDDLPLAKGNTSNESNLGYEILTANRIKLGRNNSRALVGSGISLRLSSNLTRMLEKNLQVYKAWYKLFMDQIHLLSLKPSKWETSGRQPQMGDIVLFVFTDSGYSKADKKWKLGEVVNASVTKVEIEYISKIKNSGETTLKSGEATRSRITRNPREVSILFSLSELYINSSEYFQRINADK